jgi:hypothetical protein
MNETKSAWEHVGADFNKLGAKLRDHFAEEKKASTSAESASSRASLKESVDRLAEALSDAFEAMAKASKDDEVRGDVKQVGRSLSNALGITFEEVGEDIGGALRRAGQSKDHPDKDVP